jgi:hypothetical protein
MNVNPEYVKWTGSLAGSTPDALGLIYCSYHLSPLLIGKNPQCNEGSQSE